MGRNFCLNRIENLRESEISQPRRQAYTKNPESSGPVESVVVKKGKHRIVLIVEIIRIIIT